MAVKKYDDALKQMAELKRENNTLKITIRSNEVKASKLINYYTLDIDNQTQLATKYKDEIRERDQQEILNRQRKYCEQATFIEDFELESKENELLSIIFLLEDEIQALKSDQVRLQEEFDRRTIVNQEKVKQSFINDIDVLRNETYNDICDEVGEALTDTAADNKRLTSQFKQILDELQKVQLSRDQYAKELLKAQRHISLLTQKNRLIERRMKEKDCIRHRTTSDDNIHNMQTNSPSTDKDKVHNDAMQQNTADNAVKSSSLEDYFKQCIKDAQRTSRNKM